MHLYPQTTANRNVPKGAFLFAETSTANDEQHTTYYVDPNCFVWKVGDWVGDKPQHVYIFELCRLTGDTVNMLVARVIHALPAGRLKRPAKEKINERLTHWEQPDSD